MNGIAHHGRERAVADGVHIAVEVEVDDLDAPLFLHVVERGNKLFVVGIVELGIGVEHHVRAPRLTRIGDDVFDRADRRRNVEILHVRTVGDRTHRHVVGCIVRGKLDKEHFGSLICREVLQAIDI